MFGNRIDFGWILPLVLVATIWINDTMAYIVGSLIGKTPFSSISPKKTWEGTAGGAILAIIVISVSMIYIIPTTGFWFWIGFTLIATVMGTAGDLFESKLKRMANVKDSGQIMPGHGGFLDRFDSLLLATPFVCVYVLLVLSWQSNIF
jgi:phosphatidate cytidylyltransferase